MLRRLSIRRTRTKSHTCFLAGCGRSGTEEGSAQPFPSAMAGASGVKRPSVPPCESRQQNIFTQSTVNWFFFSQWPISGLKGLCWLLYTYLGWSWMKSKHSQSFQEVRTVPHRVLCITVIDQTQKLDNIAWIGNCPGGFCICNRLNRKMCIWSRQHSSHSIKPIFVSSLGIPKQTSHSHKSRTRCQPPPCRLKIHQTRKVTYHHQNEKNVLLWAISVCGLP